MLLNMFAESLDFFEVGILSLGAHLGTIPYSGNIFFRSDSSATSTRSFAFPMYSLMQKVQHNFKKVQLKMLLNSAGTMMIVLRSQVHSRNRFKPIKIIHKASRRISRESEFLIYVTPAQPLRNKTAKPNIGID